MDLNSAELAFEWAEPEGWMDEQAMDEEAMDEEEMVEEDMDAEVVDAASPRTLQPGASTASPAAECDLLRAEVQTWQRHACELEDEMQWHRDALLQARTEASDDVLMACEGANEVRVRVEVEDPLDKRQSKLIPLAELLRECSTKRERPPILASMERVRKAQNITSTYKDRSEDDKATARALAGKLTDTRSELELTKQQHNLKLTQLASELALIQ
jgi:hypothetical protein